MIKKNHQHDQVQHFLQRIHFKVKTQTFTKALSCLSESDSSFFLLDSGACSLKYGCSFEPLLRQLWAKLSLKPPSNRYVGFLFLVFSSWLLYVSWGISFLYPRVFHNCLCQAPLQQFDWQVKSATGWGNGEIYPHGSSFDWLSAKVVWYVHTGIICYINS